jgi:Ca-activated chloride channel family protein
VLRSAAIAALAVALARPQTVAGQVRLAGRGVAIVAVLDQSTSMKTPDFPTASGPIPRLEAAKQTFARFVQGRPDDLIGLVAFANYPDLACPPTLDHDFLLSVVRALRPARPGDDGTNLGDAVAWALGAVRKTEPTKKVLILLTDGRNDPAVPNPLDPIRAARLCHELGVTLHTIAIGGAGGLVRQVEPKTGLPIPADMAGPDLELLRTMAEQGGGQAFVAADGRSLQNVFRAIDALATSPVRGTMRTRYRDWYASWIGAALAALAIDCLLLAGPLRRLP